MELLQAIEHEASAAQSAVGALTDAAVAASLALAAELVTSRAAAIVAANEKDVAAAQGRLDQGSIDRLRLDGSRISTLAGQLLELSSLPPAHARGGIVAAREWAARLRAANPGWRRRRQLRGEAERRGRHRRPAPEVVECLRPSHRQRGAAHGDDARRRGAPPRARAGRPSARRGWTRALARTGRSAAPRLVAGATPARDPPRQR